MWNETSKYGEKLDELKALLTYNAIFEALTEEAKQLARIEDRLKQIDTRIDGLDKKK